MRPVEWIAHCPDYHCSFQCRILRSQSFTSVYSAVSISNSTVEPTLQSWPLGTCVQGLLTAPKARPDSCLTCRRNVSCVVDKSGSKDVCIYHGSILADFIAQPDIFADVCTYEDHSLLLGE